MSKLSFNKDDIIAILNDTDLKLNNREKLIFSLFTLFPTRRAIDYNRMLISIEKPKNEKKLKLEQEAKDKEQLKLKIEKDPHGKRMLTQYKLTKLENHINPKRKSHDNDPALLDKHPLVKRSKKEQKAPCLPTSLAQEKSQNTLKTQSRESTDIYAEQNAFFNPTSPNSVILAPWLPEIALTDTDLDDLFK